MKHVNTAFYQLLRFIPKHRFGDVVTRYQGDYRIRHLNCWNQLLPCSMPNYPVANF